MCRNPSPPADRRATPGRLARPVSSPARPPPPSASSVPMHSIRWSAGCPIPWCGRSRRGRAPMPCTAFPSASPRTPPWSGCRSAAGLQRFCSTFSAAPAARPGCSSRPESPALPRRRPRGWPTGRRCTPISSGSASRTRCARRARPRCSSARWRRRPAGGPDAAACCPHPGSPWPPSAHTSAVTWPTGWARAPATRSRSATCPGSAGMMCAAWVSCPNGTRSAVSSATCPCWCTGRAPP